MIHIHKSLKYLYLKKEIKEKEGEKMSQLYK